MFTPEKGGPWDTSLIDEEIDMELLPIEPRYDFETYVREYDGTVCEAITGIPADVYETINLPNKIGDSL